MKLLIGTLVFLIIMLVIVGYFMAISGKDPVFPPSISDCPDHFTLSGTTCAAPAYLNINDTADISCNIQDFSKLQYTFEGTNFESGMCAKKLWANDCGVKWDGITNNETLCYA